jgi:hypothetical protein
MASMKRHTGRRHPIVLHGNGIVLADVFVQRFRQQQCLEPIGAGDVRHGKDRNFTRASLQKFIELRRHPDQGGQQIEPGSVSIKISHGLLEFCTRLWLRAPLRVAPGPGPGPGVAQRRRGHAQIRFLHLVRRPHNAIYDNSALAVNTKGLRGNKRYTSTQCQRRGLAFGRRHESLILPRARSRTGPLLNYRCPKIR